jgi:hypothetical protein
MQVARTKWTVLLYCLDVPLLLVLDVGQGTRVLDRGWRGFKNDRSTQGRIHAILPRSISQLYFKSQGTMSRLSNDRLDIPPLVQVGSRKTVEGGVSIIKKNIG